MNDLPLPRDASATQLNSPAWLIFTKLSFVLSVLAMLVGIWFAPTDLWVKGYFAMATLFLVGTTFTLAKTVRDQFEANKVINMLQEVRTEKLLKDYDPDLGVAA